MDAKSNRWANLQIFWGWAFLIAVGLLLLYLFFALWWPRLSAPSGAGVGEEAPSPAAQATRLADAEATVAAAAQKPVESAAAVREAAEVIVAATAVAALNGDPIRWPPAINGETGSDEPADGSQTAASGPDWLDWLLGAMSGLTAIFTFVGLVVTSLMKWRSDLNDVSRADLEHEKEKLQFELQKQRYELDQARESMRLEQERLKLEVERERLALARLRIAPETETDPESAPMPDADTASNGDEEDDA